MRVAALSPVGTALRTNDKEHDMVVLPHGSTRCQLPGRAWPWEAEYPWPQHKCKCLLQTGVHIRICLPCNIACPPPTWQHAPQLGPGWLSSPLSWFCSGHRAPLRQRKCPPTYTWGNEQDKGCARSPFVLACMCLTNHACSKVLGPYALHPIVAIKIPA